MDGWETHYIPPYVLQRNRTEVPALIEKGPPVPFSHIIFLVWIVWSTAYTLSLSSEGLVDLNPQSSSSLPQSAPWQATTLLNFSHPMPPFHQPSVVRSLASLSLGNSKQDWQSLQEKCLQSRGMTAHLFTKQKNKISSWMKRQRLTDGLLTL
jgi:hypothetical protein